MSEERNPANRPPDPDDASEAEFLKDYDPAAFERPSITVDLVLLTVTQQNLAAALLIRNRHPDRGRFTLPGTFVAIDESLDAAAERLLRARVGLPEIYLEQLFSFGNPERDPRMRIITVAYYALVHPERLLDLERRGLTLASIQVPWSGETGGAVSVTDDQDRPLALAFDHDRIIGMAVKRIRGKLNYTPIGYQLLPPTFTLRRLQQVHETILGGPVNKDSFRRRMLASADLEATGTLEQQVGHRPAELYRFVRRSAV